MAKDMIQLKFLREGTYPELAKSSLNAVCVFIRARLRKIRQMHRGDGDVKMEAEIGVVATSQGTPRNVDSPKKLEGTKSKFSHKACRKRAALLTF